MSRQDRIDNGHRLNRAAFWVTLAHVVLFRIPMTVIWLILLLAAWHNAQQAAQQEPQRQVVRHRGSEMTLTPKHSRIMLTLMAAHCAWSLAVTCLLAWSLFGVAHRVTRRGSIGINCCGLLGLPDGLVFSGVSLFLLTRPDTALAYQEQTR
ncbi:MAG: hypothetical protein PF961_04705 [Planctomycetota bacterium]|nr:hypothetical protein [Planctomycetota bacterium]